MAYVRNAGWVLGFFIVGMCYAQDMPDGQPVVADQASDTSQAVIDQAQQQDVAAASSPAPQQPNVSKGIKSDAAPTTVAPLTAPTQPDSAAENATIPSGAAPTTITPPSDEPTKKSSSADAGLVKAADTELQSADAAQPHDALVESQSAQTESTAPDVSSEAIAEQTAQPETSDSTQPEPESVSQTSSDTPSDSAADQPEVTPEEAPAQPDAALQPETAAQPVQAPAPEPAQPMPVMRQPRQRPTPPMPNRAAPKPESAKPGPDEIVGLDTVDLENPQGNWLFKRVWWERAEAKYEKIHEIVTKTVEARTAFSAKRTDIEKSVLDPFYVNIGFSQGELQAVLADLNGSLEVAEKTKQSQEKEDEEQEVMDSAQEEAQALKQLQQDVDQVIKHDETLDAAVMQLAEQITRMRNYEQQAWHDFKDIARVLDDKKARELFYKVDNALRNVEEIQTYIEQGFSTSFDRLSEQIKQSVMRITSTIATLKEKGFDLKKRAQELVGNMPEEKPQEQPGIFMRLIVHPIKRVLTTIASGIQMIWDYTVFAFKWPFQKIMGSGAPVQTEQSEGEESEASAPEPESVPEEAAQNASEEPEHTLNAQNEVDSPELPDTMEELDLHELALNDQQSFDLSDSEPSCDRLNTVMA